MKRGLTILLTLLILTLPTTLATYSEEEETDKSTLESITLEGHKNEISWETSGYSEKGFKVVWSKSANPTYPTRKGDKYHYHSNPEEDDDKLEAFDGTGEYYVRVCEYLGGKCGIYSNEIKMSLETEYNDDKYEKEEYEEKKKYEYEKEYEKSDKIKDKANCNGCLSNETCYPLGHRVDGTFCANSLNLTTQFSEEEVCENNFECKSNVCVSGQCIDSGFIKKVLGWLKNFFS